MTSQVFSLDYSSSEEFEAQPSRFNIYDLPNLNIPSPFQSDSSGWESPTSPGRNVASPPETPATPATPLSPGSSLWGLSRVFLENVPGAISRREWPYIILKADLLLPPPGNPISLQQSSRGL